jgi:hypothetical protein
MSKLDLNIHNNFGHYSEIPVCNTIKKILIGKLFSFNSNFKRPMIIIGVRRNNLYGHLEILVGQYNGYSISVYSWYSYNRNNILFIGRSNKEAVRNCLKRNPKYIKYHLGKYLSSKELVALPMYDNSSKYYENYYKSERNLCGSKFV